jgi:hypothetical protein
VHCPRKFYPQFDALLRERMAAKFEPDDDDEDDGEEFPDDARSASANAAALAGVRILLA